jgi:hypothetical protein
MAENMTRAQYLLGIIEQMDLEAEPQHSLKGGATGYRYQDRGQGHMQPDYPDGKRPSGLMSRAGKSA